MVSFFQCRGRCPFSGPVLPKVFQIGMLKTHAEPFPVMTVIQFQIRFLFFSFHTLTVHHITVKDRHGMVFIHKCGLSCFFACPFPLFQAAFIRRYTSKGMLDRSPPEIGRHLRKTDIKIKTGLFFFVVCTRCSAALKRLFASGIPSSSFHACP